jgi:hypothetical protein
VIWLPVSISSSWRVSTIDTVTHCGLDNRFLFPAEIEFYVRRPFQIQGPFFAVRWPEHEAKVARFLSTRHFVLCLCTFMWMWFGVSFPMTSPTRMGRILAGFETGPDEIYGVRQFKSRKLSSTELGCYTQTQLDMFQLAYTWATDQMSRSCPSSRGSSTCPWYTVGGKMGDKNLGQQINVKFCVKIGKLY